MAKLDTVKEIKELNGQTVSVELTQKQLDDLKLLAKEGEEGIDAFHEKHKEYNATLDEEHQLDLSHLDAPEQQTKTPTQTQAQTSTQVPEGESARTLAEQQERERQQQTQDAVNGQRDEIIERSKNQTGKQKLDALREQAKAEARQNLAKQAAKASPPEITSGPKVKVVLAQSIQAYGGMLFDSTTRTKITGKSQDGSAGQEVIRSPFVSQRIASGDLRVVE